MLKKKTVVNRSYDRVADLLLKAFEELAPVESCRHLSAMGIMMLSDV